MMTKLLKFFDDNLTLYSQIANKKGITTNHIITGSLVLYIILFLFSVITTNYIFIISNIFIFIICIVIACYIDSEAIKKKLPKIYISPCKYDKIELEKIFIKELDKVLWDQSEASLELIQKQIKENENNAKLSWAICISICAALLIPFWSSLIDFSLKQLEENLQHLAIFSVCIILVIILFSMIGQSLLELRDTIFTKAQKWSRLNKLITEYRIKRNSKNN